MDAYQHVQTGAIVIDRSAAAGRVRVTGRDRLDLLHRLSTQDLRELPVGRRATTVLTTPIARIVDRIDVLNLGEHLLLVTGSGRATPVRRWLSGYIFFRDDVKLADASTELGQIALVGAGAAKILAAELPGLDPAQMVDTIVTADTLSVVRARQWGSDGFVVLPEAGAVSEWVARLKTRGAVLADDDEVEQLRVRAGEPAAGHELTEAYLPLELDLWDAVSFSKGCYIGQEILARMESRGKLARRLRGLRAEAPLTVGAEVRAASGGAGRADGSVGGVVTSAVVLPDLGPVGLAVLRTAIEPGQTVVAGDVPATVVELPLTV